MNTDELLETEQVARKMVRDLAAIGWDTSMIEPALDGIVALWYGPKPEIKGTASECRQRARHMLITYRSGAKRLAFEIGMQSEMWGEW